METSEIFDDYINFEKAEQLNNAGGTSLTYKVRINGRIYFMKRLRPEYIHDTRHKQLFIKEFEAGKSINHPGIIKYISMGEDKEGPYILMEFINGWNLKELLDKEPKFFNDSKILYKLISQTLLALQALHKNNIIFLDLSPKNIMLTKASSEVKLIDLGFCINDANDYTGGCTKGFSAPEINEQNPANIDIRADIYSVGCILQYIEEKSNKKLPHSLQQIKKRCLQQEKEKRYPTVDNILFKIKNRKRNTLLLVATAIIAAFSLCVAFTRTTLYENITNYIGWEMQKFPEKFEEGDIFYRIKNHDKRTVEVTYQGERHDEVIGEYKDIVVIPATVKHKGRTFRVTSIGDDAIRKNYNKRIIIPNGVDSIGNYAFSQSAIDSTLFIPESVKFIGVGITDCNIYLQGIVVDKNNARYDSRENCNAIIEKATNTLVAGCKNSKIPESVIKIGNSAFAEMINLREIDIPSSVTHIGDYAFYLCPFNKVTLPDSLTHLGSYAFQWCEKLAEITIPDNVVYIGEAALSHCAYSTLVIPDKVKTIGNYAFDNCHNLTTVTIGKRVSHIGAFAFDGCNKLTKITSHIPADRLFAVDKSTFGSIAEYCTLYVPRGAKDAYRNTNGWNSFSKIVEVNM